MYTYTFDISYLYFSASLAREGRDATTNENAPSPRPKKVLHSAALCWYSAGASRSAWAVASLWIPM